MEKLTFERTPPIQGEPVNVYVSGSRGKSGQIILTYEEWLHFNKLLKEGQDSLKKKNETRIVIEIKGIEGKEVKPLIKPEFKKLSNEQIDAAVDALVEDMRLKKSRTPSMIELDEDDAKAVELEEGKQKLVRSLIGEGENE